MIISINQAIAVVDGSDSYTLNTGKSAISQLEQQQKYLAENSYQHLYKAGLKSGQIVWDIGCGTGIMTDYLAKVVGLKGHVYAMDISNKQLEVVKKRLEKNNITNVTLVLGNILSYNQSRAFKADLIYSRLLLMHLRQPLNALKSMSVLLKDDGKIALQESIFSSAHAFPKNESFNRYIEILIALAKSKGTDYNIGNDLKNLSAKAGFHNIDSYIVKFKVPVTAKYKGTLIKRLNDVRAQIVEAKISSDKEIDELINAFGLVSNNENAYVAQCDQSYIIATKN